MQSVYYAMTIGGAVVTSQHHIGCHDRLESNLIMPFELWAVSNVVKCSHDSQDIMSCPIMIE